MFTWIFLQQCQLTQEYNTVLHLLSSLYLSVRLYYFPDKCLTNFSLNFYV
jgi:hypothetical protein